jgi:hypothetical protein
MCERFESPERRLTEFLGSIKSTQMDSRLEGPESPQGVFTQDFSLHRNDRIILLDCLGLLRLATQRSIDDSLLIQDCESATPANKASERFRHSQVFTFMQLWATDPSLSAC